MQPDSAFRMLMRRIVKVSVNGTTLPSTQALPGIACLFARLRSGDLASRQLADDDLVYEQVRIDLYHRSEGLPSPISDGEIDVGQTVENIAFTRDLYVTWFNDRMKIPGREVSLSASNVHIVHAMNDGQLEWKLRHYLKPHELSVFNLANDTIPLDSLRDTAAKILAKHGFGRRHLQRLGLENG